MFVDYIWQYITSSINWVNKETKRAINYLVKNILKFAESILRRVSISERSPQLLLSAM